VVNILNPRQVFIRPETAPSSIAKREDTQGPKPDKLTGKKHYNSLHRNQQDSVKEIFMEEVTEDKEN
jgi:hypothetical protein